MDEKQLYLTGFNKKNQKDHKKLMLILSLDKIILSSVVIVLLLTLTFSIGVEKGKKVAYQNNSDIDKDFDENHINQTSKTILETNYALKKNISESVDDISISNKIADNSLIEPESSNGQNESIAINSDTKIKINTSDEKNTNKISYSIQVASFLKENSAHQEAEELKKQGYAVSLIKKGKYVVVCVGDYENEIEAKNKLNLLKKKYKDCLLRRL